MGRSKGISGSRSYAAVLGSLVLLVASLAGGIVWYNSVKMSELALVSTNRLVWRPLYRLAETKYRLES